MRPVFQLGDGGPIPTSPLQLRFETCNVKAACELNALWHSRLPKIDWSNVVRNKHYICYVAGFDNIYYAVAIWSSPVAANRMKDGQALLELRRFAISPSSPKNTASRMLSWMVRDIRKRFPDIVGLVSYQDKEVHKGTIYKASGWSVATTTKFADWGASRKRNAPQSRADKVRWELHLDKRVK